MNEEHFQPPTESDVFAASEGFAEPPGARSSFAVAAESFLGVDAFNPTGPVPAAPSILASPIDASCIDVHRSLSVYLDGELSLPQQNAVQTHLAVCGPCQTAQAFQMQVRTTVATRALDRMPDDVRARITRALGFE